MAAIVERRPRAVCRGLVIFAAAVALATWGPAQPASADHEDNPRQGLEEAGFHGLDNTGFHTDIMPWVSENGGVYAATGTWGTALEPSRDCPSETDNPADPHDSGVKIIDATDPANPEKAAHLGTIPGSQNNDIKVARLPTVDGPKDILVQSLEPCGAFGLLHQVPGTPAIDFLSELLGTVDADQTGFQVYDVSDPENPVELGTWNNGGLGTHNLYLFSQDDRAYVAAVYNEVDFIGLENRRLIEGHLQIIEITDPDDPTLVSQWNLYDAEGQGGPPEDEMCVPRGTDSQFCYNHDVWISDDGRIAYNAWWDGGLVLLDISDPANPTFIGQAQGQVRLPDDPEGWLGEEGNTHSMIPMEVDGRHIVVVGDEDFTGGAQPGVTVNEPDALQAFHETVQWAGTAPVEGQTSDFVYVGAGCHQTDYLQAGGPAAIDGKIVLVNHRAAEPPFPPCVGPYTFSQKVNLAAENGAIGFVQYPDEGGEPDPNATAISAPIPGLELFDNAASRALHRAVVESSPVVNPGDPGLAVNATLERGGEVDPFGFMRVLDVGAAGSVEELDDPSEWREVSQFKAPHVEDANPPPDSTFTAHNPILGPDGRVYFSWYTNGVRVLELEDAGRTVNETAWFVPLPTDREGDNDSDPRGIREDNAGFWGSWPVCHPDTGELLIFNSDSNRGIYILRALYDDCREGEPGEPETPPPPPPSQPPPSEPSPPDSPPPPAPPDAAVCAGELATIAGTEGPDVLVGTPGPDVIQAFGGDDVIRGLAGDDLICAGPGDDVARGGPGDDVIRGGKGNDVLGGGPGRDVIRGGPGRDVIRGGRGPDTLGGGNGNDVIRGGKGDDVIRGGKGDDVIRGGKGDDQLFGDKGDDQIFGGPGDDLIRSGQGKDRIFPGVGRNRVVAVKGRNRIECHKNGNDTVITNRVSVVIGCDRVFRR